MKYVASAVILVGFAALYLWIFLRSYRRNLHSFGRSNGSSVFVAFWAAWFWPLTLLWWMFGETPERRSRRR
ncbi:MAG TPA: hypothetical protein VI916_12845 [Acidimicrobiia bacterium]|nr:hypothetical protein [Acidimicrobiia bacterium]